MQLQISGDDGRTYSLSPQADVPSAYICEGRVYTLKLITDSDLNDLAGCHLLLGGLDHGAGRYERAGTLSWTWQVSEYVGRVEVQLMQGEAELTPWLEISVDPNLRKLTQSQFSAMVEEIAQQALVAYSLSPATQGVALQQQWQRLGLSQLEYLRQRLTALQRAVEAIAERPLRRLERHQALVAFASAPPSDSGSLSRLLRDLQDVAPTKGAKLPPAVRRLQHRLKGTLPIDISVDRQEISYDVYENRLLKHFLARLYRVLRRTRCGLIKASIARSLDEDIRKLAARRAEELLHYQRILYSLQELDFLQEVAPLRSFKPVTPALRKDPWYANFYTLYRQFERAISPFSDGPFQLSLEKTWQLYEYWCFFEVVDVLRGLCHESLSFDTHAMLRPHRDGVSVSLPNAEVRMNDRVSIHFQKTYSYYGWSHHNPPSRAGTYSHEMRPDISIEIRDDGGTTQEIILLDPKYRVGYSSINQALDDLHRYKDAIVGPDGTRLVRTALVLCPSDAEAKLIYFDLSYIQVHGLGAVALAPGGPDGRLRLAGILSELLCGSLDVACHGLLRIPGSP